MKVGLVLEGGAMRGLYTSGVLDVFLDNNIEVDCIIGVSAGALFGINYCSKQKGRVLRYQKKYVLDKDYMSLKNLIQTGDFINKQLAYYDIPRKHDVFDEKEFKKSKTKFYLVVTNVETGKAEYIKITDTEKQIKYFEATAAMPFVSTMVEIGDKKYLDGALADSIPLVKMQEMGYDKIIVIQTKIAGYRKKKPAKFLANRRYRGHTKLIDAINTRYMRYNAAANAVDELEKRKEIFVFRPSRKVNISRVEKDPARLQEMYDLGVMDATDKLNDLLKYLEK